MADHRFGSRFLITTPVLADGKSVTISTDEWHKLLDARDALRVDAKGRLLRELDRLRARIEAI